MSSMCFDLFLDESGEFDNKDLDRTRKPSLIGGLLVPADVLTSDLANEICEGKFVHISEANQNALTEKDREENSAKAIRVLNAVKTKLKGAFPVIWQNNERLQKAEANELYFFMMTEGIANLLEKLSIENQQLPIKLNVYIAQRVIDPTQTYNSARDAVFSEQEYITRLYNSINTRITNKNMYINKGSGVALKTFSAREDSKLMIQDVICNTYLTRDSKKFDSKQKKEITEFYSNNRYISNINKPDYEQELAKALAGGNIVDLFFLAFDLRNRKSAKAKKAGEVIKSCVDTMNNIGSHQLEIQDSLLSIKMEKMLNDNKNLELTEDFLNMVDDEILAKVTNDSPEFKMLKFNIELYKFTVHTHMGKNADSEDDARICNEMLEELKKSGSFKYIEYSSIYANRVSVFFIDCLAYKKAVESLDGAINASRKINEALKEISGVEMVKSGNFAKLLGTRLQAYTRLIAVNECNLTEAKKYYELAMQDSDESIKNFTSKDDIARQCNYRSDIETEMGNVEEALKILYYGVEGSKLEHISSENIIHLCSEISKIPGSSKDFTICQYIKIMDKAKKVGKVDLSKLMYEALIAEAEIKNLIERNEISVLSVNNKKVGEKINVDVHPYELTYFYYGEYLNDVTYIEKSIEICDKLAYYLTIQIFEISAKAKKCAMLLGTDKEEETMKDFLEFTENICKNNFGNNSDGKTYPTNEILSTIQEDIAIIKEGYEEKALDKNDMLDAFDEIIRKIKI